MAAILIIALMAQRNANNQQYSTSSRATSVRTVNNRSTTSRGIFRNRSSRSGFGSRFRRF